MVSFVPLVLLWQRSVSLRGFFYELLYGAIHAISDVNISFGAYRDDVCFAKLTEALAGFTSGGENLSFKVHFQKLACETVHHIDILLTNVDAARESGKLQLFDEFSVGIKDLYALILSIGDP